MINVKFSPDIEIKIQDPKLLDDFKIIINDEHFGFFDVTRNSNLLSETKKVFEKFKHKKYFIHVGIGGSHLGAEMLVTAVGKKSDTKFIFINNIDSDEIFDQLQGVPPKDCLFHIVSKSGTTAETMASMAILSTWSQLPLIDFKNHFVFTTDSKIGDLRKMANEFDITTLEIPSNVGGRFSALTPVGLLPAIFAGINIENLFHGAEKIKSSLLNPILSENFLVQTSTVLTQLRKKGITQTVFMPYSSKLKNLSFWFVQLWAESLGKKIDQKGQVINTGFTPIPAFGAADQHSQVQLFMEGPYDKCLIMIEIRNRAHDFSLNNSLPSDCLKKLKNYSLNQLIQAEFQGTLKALNEAKRSYIHLSIEVLSEENLGALILYLESLTVLVGNILLINPFDQPGVEAGKKFASEWLAKI